MALTSGDKPVEKQPDVPAPPNPKMQYLTLLRHNLTLLKRSVAHVEQRYTARVLRSLPYVRRQVQEKADVLACIVSEGLPESGMYICLLTLSVGP
ncbi:hypothetical protein ACI68E_001304 [Malassezia pachydermatis]